MCMSTKFELHPDCTESYNLKSWYDKHGIECVPMSISRSAICAGGMENIVVIYNDFVFQHMIYA